MSINWWRDKQSGVHPYNGILFSHRKEWSTNTRYHMNEPQNHYAQWKKPGTKEHIWFHLFEMSGLGKSIEAENRLEVGRGWRWGMGIGEWLLMGMKFGGGGDEKVLKLY